MVVMEGGEEDGTEHERKASLWGEVVGILDGDFASDAISSWPDARLRAACVALGRLTEKWTLRNEVRVGFREDEEVEDLEGLAFALGALGCPTVPVDFDGEQRQAGADLVDVLLREDEISPIRAMQEEGLMPEHQSSHGIGKSVNDPDPVVEEDPMQVDSAAPPVTQMSTRSDDEHFNIDGRAKSADNGAQPVEKKKKTDEIGEPAIVRWDSQKVNQEPKKQSGVSGKPHLGDLNPERVEAPTNVEDQEKGEISHATDASTREYPSSVDVVITPDPLVNASPQQEQMPQSVSGSQTEEKGHVGVAQAIEKQDRTTLAKLPLPDSFKLGKDEPMESMGKAARGTMIILGQSNQKVNNDSPGFTHTPTEMVTSPPDARDSLSGPALDDPPSRGPEALRRILPDEASPSRDGVSVSPAVVDGDLSSVVAPMDLHDLEGPIDVNETVEPGKMVNRHITDVEITATEPLILRADSTMHETRNNHDQLLSPPVPVQQENLLVNRVDFHKGNVPETDVGDEKKEHIIVPVGVEAGSGTVNSSQQVKCGTDQGVKIEVGTYSNRSRKSRAAMPSPTRDQVNDNYSRGVGSRTRSSGQPKTAFGETDISDPYLLDCLVVLKQVLDEKLSIPFRRKVLEKDAPNYFDIIKKPMDLSEIRRNMESGTISTPVEFQRDMLLVAKNAMHYNEKTSDLYHLAKELQAMVKEKVDPIVKKWKSENPTRSPASSRKESTAAPVPSPTMLRVSGRRSRSKTHEDDHGSPTRLETRLRSRKASMDKEGRKSDDDGRSDADGENAGIGVAVVVNDSNKSLQECRSETSTAPENEKETKTASTSSKALNASNTTNITDSPQGTTTRSTRREDNGRRLTASRGGVQKRVAKARRTRRR
mmetsp:Transcript_14838/g.30192  ORF Transcript_14838/g.30192 Transcript_14838/m.30192 type:complete len:877 (-) Transcript_14838:510-3140(-)